MIYMENFIKKVKEGIERYKETKEDKYRVQIMVQIIDHLNLSPKHLTNLDKLITKDIKAFETAFGYSLFGVGINYFTMKEITDWDLSIYDDLQTGKELEDDYVIYSDWHVIMNNFYNKNKNYGL